jgi:C-terminal processing protease CtpA/Prc
MKKSFVLFTIIFFQSIQLIAQPIFDSANYYHFYNKLFPSAKFDSTIVINALTNEEKIEALSKVWYEAKFNFANFDKVPYLNWDSVYKAFIPIILATKNIHETYRVLQQMNQLLRDGHSRIIEPLYYFLRENDNLPFICKYIDGKVVVVKNLSNELPYSNVKEGWVVTAINHIPVQEYIRKNISPYLHFSTTQDSISRIYTYELFKGYRGSKVQVTFLNNQQRPIVQQFQRSDNFKLPIITFLTLPNNIGYLQINSFETDEITKTFDSLFSAITSTKALIIDVRLNGGGNSNVGYEILGCLTKQPFMTSLNVLHTYQPAQRAWGNGAIHVQLELNDWKPYKKLLYEKPVILLTSAATYSAAEDFTIAFKQMNRGKIFGEPTGGSTGQPLGYNLPGGGLGFICTKRDVMANGTEFVGVGIMPDFIINPTLAGIQNGKDEVLEAALQYIQFQKN